MTHPLRDKVSFVELSGISMHTIRFTKWFALAMILSQATMSSAQNHETLPSLTSDNISYAERMALILNVDTHAAAYEKKLNIAQHLDDQGKTDSALYWMKSILESPGLSDEQKASVYGGISYVYGRQGDYIAAIDAHLRAIRYSNDEHVKAKLKISAGNFYLSLQDHSQALKNVNEGITTLRKDSNYFWIATALGIKANIYKDLEQNQKALALYLESYRYNERSKKSDEAIRNRHITLNNIATIHLELGRSDSAQYYLSQTSPEFEILPEYLKSGIYINYGELYTLLRQPELARRYYQNGIQLAESGNFHDMKIAGYKGLAALFGRQGNYRKAWEYARDYTQLYTEALSEENRSKIGQLHTRYALEKKDKEMAQKELQYNKRQLALQRRNNQLYLWIVSIGLSVLIIGILLRNQYNKNRFLKLQLKNAANENLLNQVQASLRGEETERERIARELHDHVMSELMATQLNLKDIEHYHPELKASSRYENILIQMEETTELLRRTTHNMMPVGLKETGLATTIEAFLYRVSNHQLMISFQCFGEKKKLADSTEKILLSITHELVQNVVKHAHATESLVQLNYYSDSLSLTVEDNGVGMSKQDEISDDGLGWHNIRRNVAALSGTVDIQSSEQEGTTVLIEIPL